MKREKYYIKCVVCEKPAMENSIVCSEQCGKIRLKVLKLVNKYFPTHGCDNCWEDLHSGCSETCKREFKEAGDFNQDLWALVNLSIGKK